MVRRPYDPTKIGASYAKAPLFLHHLPAAPSGSYRSAATAIDGVARLFELTGMTGHLPFDDAP